MLASALSLLLFIKVASSLSGIAIENGVEGNPELYCEPNSLSIVFKSRKAFSGRTFVKGYVQHDECVQYGNEGTQHRFTIQFDQCGIRRSREYNGISVSATVIVSFHKLFVTRLDRAYHLRCFYLEASKTLSQHMDVSMMTTIEIAKQTELPICRYDILTGGPTGSPIRFARVGDMVYHKWSCTSEVEDLYCMKVHSCVVYDGQGGQSVELIDKDGCAVEPAILSDLEYLGDLITGQRASVFKFADRSALYFSCQIELLVKDPYSKCALARPHCKPQVFVTAATEDEDSGADDEYSASVLSAGTEEQVGEYPPSLKDSPLSDSQRISAKTTIGKFMSNKAVNQSQTVRSAAKRTTVPEASSPTPSYSRLLRAKRNVTENLLQINGLNQKLRRIANVDLPEQSLTVFGIENDQLPSKKELSNVAEALGIKNSAAEICFSTSKMTVVSIVLAALLCSALTVLLVVIQKQRHRLDKVYFK